MSRPDQEARNEKNRERGYRQERRIIAQLEIEPMTVRELAAKVHLSDDSVINYLRRLRQSSPKRAYVCGHKGGGPKIKPAPMYALGDLPDVKLTKKPYQKKGKVDVVAMMRESILKILQTPLTSRQLSMVLKISLSRTTVYLRMLRVPDNRQVRICAWVPSNGKGDLAPVYQTSTDKDRRKPKHTRKQLHARMMANPERRARYLAREAAKRVQMRTRAKPVGIFSALGL